MTPPLIRILELRSVRGTGGGPEKTILVGAERADRTRFAVTVCYIRDVRDEVFGIDRRAEGMAVDYCEVRERHSFDPRIWRELRELVVDRRIDIIHGHDYKTDLLAWLLSRRTGATAVATAHGWTGQSWRERTIYYPAHKRLIARFRRVIAVSTDIRDALVAHGASAHRVSVVLNGIDPTAFRRSLPRVEPIRLALAFSPTDVVIGAVGRIERQKRFDLLLEACAALAPQRPHLRLVIVGDGSLRADLEAHAQRLKIEGMCRFLGQRDDLVDLHHAFDVFVQSSEYEGTPNAVLEAMAMETPIIATDAGGTRELALPDEHALIVPLRDVSSLAAAIGAVVDHPASARARAAAARRRVETDLSFDARTRRVEAIYEELMRAPGGRATTVQSGEALAPHA